MRWDLSGTFAVSLVAATAARDSHSARAETDTARPDVARAAVRSTASSPSTAARPPLGQPGRSTVTCAAPTPCVPRRTSTYRSNGKLEPPSRSRPARAVVAAPNGSLEGSRIDGERLGSRASSRTGRRRLRTRRRAPAIGVRPPPCNSPHARCVPRPPCYWRCPRRRMRWCQRWLPSPEPRQRRAVARHPNVEKCSCAEAAKLTCRSLARS